MRRVAGVLAAMVAGGSALLAQAPQAPVFRGGVTLVTVDVTVLDHDGKPVPGLTADDFEMKLDGTAEPVRTVAYETTTTAQAAPATVSTATPTREVTNAAPPAEPRLFVILADDLIIPATRDRDLFHSASHFVADLPATDVVGFTTTSGTVTVNPTRDRGAVEAGLKRLAGQFVDPRTLPPDVTVGLDEAVEITAGDNSTLLSVVSRDCFNGRPTTQKDLVAGCAEDVELKVRRMGMQTLRVTEEQLSSYQKVIEAMRTAPGQKFLVILSDGLLMTTRGKDQAIDLEPVGRAAAAAGVQLTVLFAAPETVSMTARSSDDSKVLRDDGLSLMQGVETVADITGGNFYRVMGQPDRFFGFVAQATSGVYHLGIEAPAGSERGREFKLAARVKRSGVTVHANRVAVLAAPPAVIPPEEQLQTAVTKGALSYGVPIAVGTVIRRAATPAEIEIGANVDIPASAPGPLAVMFGLLDAGGTLRTGKKTVEAPSGGGNYRISLSLPVVPGPYRLRFAVADAGGQVGSVDLPVTAQLGHVGPFLTSDVLTAWSGASGESQFLALEEVPAAATTLATGLELYAASSAPLPADVSVRWSVLTEAGQPVTEQTVAAGPAADRLTAQGRIALSTLPAATYEIRATILVAGQAVGAVSTTIRKTDKEQGPPAWPTCAPRHQP